MPTPKYGPTYTVDLAAPVDRLVDLADGTCRSLDPRTADRYFGAAVGPEDRFRSLTARAICAHCPVQVDCLTDAIRMWTRTDTSIRGGQPPFAVMALRAEHTRERTSARVLAERAIARQVVLTGVASTFHKLRQGEFESVTPMLDEVEA